MSTSVDNSAMMGLMENDDIQTSSSKFTDSSVRSFTNQIKSAMDGQNQSPDSQKVSPPKKTMLRPSLPRQTSVKPLRDYVLPSRQRADHLLALYWRLVGSLYPFLDADEVQTSYQCLWTGEALGENGIGFLCLLNVMFSLACKLDSETSPPERRQSADAFYQRAREFLDIDMLQSRSIINIQCLLLLGQYLQSTNDSQQCWIFIGLAVRIAQSLALDLPSTTEELEDNHEREVIRRVWHGCVLMDRTLSMTFGRPSMITAQAAATVPRPMPHLIGQACHCFISLCSPNSHESCHHFFIEALRLYELMSETLATLYNPTGNGRSPEVTERFCHGAANAVKIGNVLEMDKSLWSWHQQLPLHLQYDPSATKSTAHHRQSHVLWLRYHHIRTLLFRPLLSLFCSPQERQKPVGSAATGLAWQIALQCSVSCVQTALATIHFLDAALLAHKLEELDETMPAWWYSIFYAYSAATVLVAAGLQDDIVAHVSNNAITDGRHAVMRVFKKFALVDSHASRCAAAINVLFDRVSQQNLERQHATVPKTDPRPAEPLQQPSQTDHAINDGHGQMELESAKVYGRKWTQSVSLPNETFPKGLADARHRIGPHDSTLTTIEAPKVPHSTSASGANWVFGETEPSQPSGAFDSGVGDDYAAIVGLLDHSEVDMDLEGMSWLNSHPSDFYGSIGQSWT